VCEAEHVGRLFKAPKSRRGVSNHPKHVVSDL
jgi:hypothetical protein